MTLTPPPVGRMQIEGTVTDVKRGRSVRGSWAQPWKMTIRSDDGQRYVGPVPPSIEKGIVNWGSQLGGGEVSAHPRIGARVRMMATTTPSKVAGSHYFSHPARAFILPA